MDSLLFEAFIYLAAGVCAAPIAQKLGLGTVLGYLAAGVIIGPLLGLVGAEAQRLQEFAEFGVVMMLFLVGLELEPQQLWSMRNRLLGLGGLQVGGTALVCWVVAWLVGTPWTVALAIGLIAAGSSTAIVLQTLEEKGLMRSDGGKASFAVLLFQDISVIPILAILPLLAIHGLGAETATAHDAEKGLRLLDGLPVWQTTLLTLLAVAVVVLGGHFLTRPLFRFVAGAKVREAFTATALLMVISIALLMSLVGLSPALGTFLAGVVLANSEYRHELESDIGPFKGLLLGLFFITVGAGIDFSLLAQHLVLVCLLTVGLIVIKAAVLWCVASLFRLRGSDRWLFALGLAQAGEFAFVLLSFVGQNGVIATEMARMLTLVVALSMLVTPFLFIVLDRLILPRMTEAQARSEDQIDVVGVAIIAGIGRFGQIVNRLLRSHGYETVVLDLSAETVDTMSKFGIKAFFGDAARPDLLEAAGIGEAKLLVVAVDDREHALNIVKYARQRRPDIHIVSRAYDRLHVYDLYSAGSDDIIRETFDSAVRAGRCALEALGKHPHEAEKAVGAFVRRDRRSLLRLAELYDPDIPPMQNQPYVDLAKRIRAEEDQMMTIKGAEKRNEIDRAWMPPPVTDKADDA